MDDAQIKAIIKIVADEAWEIASNGGAPDTACLAIEDLSDDPETCAKLVETIKSNIAVPAR